MTKPTVVVRFTKEELWEAMELIGQGFEPGPGNELAEAVSDKLSAAYLKLKDANHDQ